MDTHQAHSARKQATSDHAQHVDLDRAAEHLAREHEVLANLQGVESMRVDGLVQDVGTIKGNVQSLQGDI
jgi:hypothetical protein